ncbi:MAG: hypothetical protein IJH87_03120, partial [Atopobiaceae bacterium]|nr:hypothetical protein [Atopobiaceae bacterium]
AAPTGSPQPIYPGTPPKMDNGALVFGRIHDRVRVDAPEGFCWSEWSSSDVPDPEDPESWYRFNPSLGIVLDERALKADAIRMLPEEFAIEHYGYWPQEAKATPISDQIWRAREAVSPKEGRYAYAVKFSPDRRTVALCGARKPEIGPTHVELIGVFPFEKAIRELEGWLLERQDRASMVVLDGITGAPTLEDRLLQGGYRRKVVVRPNGRQLLEATSRFYEAIRSGGMTHGPGEPLALSATGAVRRAIGKDGSWAFGSTPQADSTPIEAACWAWWAAETTKRDPTRRTVARW